MQLAIQKPNEREHQTHQSVATQTPSSSAQLSSSSAMKGQQNDPGRSKMVAAKRRPRHSAALPCSWFFHGVWAPSGPSLGSLRFTWAYCSRELFEDVRTAAKSGNLWKSCASLVTCTMSACRLSLRYLEITSPKKEQPRHATTWANLQT